MRNGLSVKVVRDGRRYIRPNCYLDYGIMVKHNAGRAHIDVDEIFQRDRVVAVTSSVSPESPRNWLSPPSFFTSSHDTNALFQATSLPSQDANVQRLKQFPPQRATSDTNLDNALMEADSTVLKYQQQYLQRWTTRGLHRTSVAIIHR